MDFLWPKPSKIAIPVSKPTISSQDVERVTKALWAEELSKGAAQEEFERSFGEYHGRDVLTVSNGSVAIMLALRALGIGLGDEVVVPALSYAATASSVVNVGAIPKFCDVDLDDWNLSPAHLEAAITPRTKAIIAVHNYGYCVDVKKIRELATFYNLPVIEDTAEGLGGFFEGQPLGTFFEVATWSFYGNKVITSGEGGAVSSPIVDIFEKMKLLRGQGMDPSRQFYFTEPGYNFRLSNVSSALLGSQFARFSEINDRRRKIFEYYKSSLQDVGIFQIARADSTPAPWLFSLRFNAKEKTKRIAKKLADLGIETRPIFYPLPAMPAFSKFSSGDYDNSSQISNSGISLPTYESLKSNEIELICESILEESKK